MPAAQNGVAALMAPELRRQGGKGKRNTRLGARYCAAQPEARHAGASLLAQQHHSFTLIGACVVALVPLLCAHL